MYEELHLQIILFEQADVVRTSNSDWYDENVDNDGWT